MSIPTCLAEYLCSQLGMEAAENILEGTSHHMVDTRQPIGRRRSLIENKRFLAITKIYTLLEDIIVFPKLQYLLGYLGQF